MHPKDFLTKKHFIALIALSAAINAIIASVVFYFTMNAVISAIVAATLFTADYIALKILIQDKN